MYEISVDGLQASYVVWPCMRVLHPGDAQGMNHANQSHLAVSKTAPVHLTSLP
jgi:hypothetical protein